MSNISNERFIELIQDSFDCAIGKKKWDEARIYLKDLFDFGFDTEGEQLTKELDDAIEKEKLLQDSINEDSHDA